MSGSQSNSQGPSIQFTNFPSTTWRSHGVFAEIQPAPSNAGPGTQRALLIGQILAAGTAAPNVPVQAFSQSQVNTLCGTASMLARMYAKYAAQDQYGEVWLLPLSDNGAGVQAAGTITLSGTATAAGTLPLWVAGYPIYTAVNVGDTAAVVAAAVTTQAALLANNPCTIGNASAIITATARHKGLVQNAFDIRMAYLGAVGGEAIPAGITAVIVQPTAGVTNPVLTTALANLGNMPFDALIHPYTDATSLTAIEGLLSEVTGRWAPISQIYGHAFTAFAGTLSAITTFGAGRNNKHETVLGYFDSPTPVEEAAADFGAACFRSAKVDPGLPFQELALNLLAPPIQSRFSKANRNTLLFDGIATFSTAQDGVCRIDRAVTTYQFAPSGAPDASWLDTEPNFQLMLFVRSLVNTLSNNFGRKKLVADGVRIPVGSNAASPSTVLAAANAFYIAQEAAGNVQQSDKFIANSAATLGNVSGQVFLYLPIILAGQLRQIAALVTFSTT